MRFHIKFEPEKQAILDELFGGVYARGLDMSPAMRQVTTVYLERQRALFEGVNDWAPLTPGTIATKERTGHQQMMVKSGLLKGSLTLRKTSNKYASTESATTFAIMGTKAPHAHLQAIGTKERDRWRTGWGPTGKVTGRSMAFVDEAMVTEFFSILESWMLDGTTAPGTPETNVVDLSGYDTALGI